MTSLLAESSSGPQRRAETQKPKVPEHDLYSWRQLSPTSRLVYIRDPNEVEAELSRLPPGPLGFDLEWKPTYLKGAPENPVAVVQLASEDTILLIQRLLASGFPAPLQTLLENPNYSKAGVSILNDCKKLWKDYGINVRNCIDLGLLARTVDNARWKGKYSLPIGLARLCETYHELSLAKGKVQRSNWEALLTPQQQDYAANDCHSGLTIFKKLYPLVETMNPKPLPAFYSFDVFQGYPYQPSVAPQPMMLWQPHNPFYDPGPPPPPKQPKGADKPSGSASTTEAVPSGHEAASSSSNVRPKGRNYRPPPLGQQSSAPTSDAGSVYDVPAGRSYPSRTDYPSLQANLHGPARNRYGGSREGGPGRGQAGRGRGRGRGGFGLFSANAASSNAAQQL